MNSTARDLDGLEPDGDILIAGSQPDALRAFAALPNVSPLADLEESGVLCSAGTKLGSSFYKLADLNPSSDSVKRGVRGLGMEFTVPG